VAGIGVAGSGVGPVARLGVEVEAGLIHAARRESWFFILGRNLNQIIRGRNRGRQVFSGWN